MTQDPGQLGKYRILAEIGKGGFATVYRALDTSLDREVALKVLDPILARDPAWVARFQREAKAVARLRHPHIVTIHEIGESEGRLYIAMELIEGPSLAERIAEHGRLPWGEALAILGQVAAALDDAHGQGVLHRDLKPANILLDPQRGAILTDFGFARLVGESSMSVSLSGGVVGTPAYIAPEVWDGEEPTAQTDIYSLGCVAYEMLTGEVLFAGKTPSMVIKKHTVDGPSLPDDAHWPAGVPNGVFKVLARALAKDPAERYAGAGALIAALSGLRQPAKTPVRTAAPPGSPRREDLPTAAPTGLPAGAAAHPRPRRLWPAVGVGGVALLVVLALVIKATLGGGQAPPTPMASTPAAAAVAVATTVAPIPPTLVAPTSTPLSAPSPTDTPAPPPDPTNTPAPTETPVSTTQDTLALTLARGVTLELVRVPAGEFVMGSDKAADPLAFDNELPQHWVSLGEYWIGKYEVTVAQFAAFVQATGYETTAEKAGTGWTYTGSSWEEVKGADWQHPRGPGSDVAAKMDHPVTLVSWDDAAAFSQWASQVTGRTIRLPSEAEWEKAARGADGQIYPWGNETPTDALCNFNMNVEDTTPVGRYSPAGDSPYGCADMAGNVWEWTNSLYREYPYRSDDGREAASDRGARVLRGGSFDDASQLVRCAFRYRYFPENRDDHLGFRVVSPGL